MRLTIAQVAYPLAPVGPGAVGGAEQVLHACDVAVVAAGHRSVVVAAAGSRTHGELVPLPPVPDDLDDDAIGRARAAARDAVRDLLPHVDVLHFHGVDFPAYLPGHGPPALVTLHLSAAHYGALPDRPRTTFAAVSATQRAGFPSDQPLVQVANGVDLERLHPDPDAEGYVLALGRLCPEKGLELALDAADQAGLPLVVAGRLFGYPAHRAWFERVEPRLRAPHRWIGPIAGEEKRRWLARARCLVVPSQIAETSSLVAMEALACGTPVVAWASGALPEIVEDGVTGRIVSSVDALAEALATVGALDRGQCRRTAERRFDGRRTAARYVSLYEALAHPPRAPRHPSPPPEAEVVTTPERLAALPWDALHARCGGGPFLRRSWVLPWAVGADVQALALWRGGTLDGLLPLRRRGDALEPLGAPWTDRHDALLARPEDAGRLLGALGEVPDWTRCRLPELAPGSPLVHAPLPAAWSDDVVDGAVSPRAAFSPDLWSGLPATLRRRVARARATAARRCDVAYELADADGLSAALDTLDALHAARWAVRGGAGVLGAPEVHRFLRRAAPGLHVDGVLRLLLVHLDGEPAAAILGLLHGGALHAWISGFDPRRAAASPGLLALARLVELAHAEGATALDLLRGREPYKYDWGAVDAPSVTRIIGR